VLAFEVFDNLPHDKAVRWSHEGPWQEVHIGSSFPCKARETTAPSQASSQPLSQKLLCHCRSKVGKSSMPSGQGAPHGDWSQQQIARVLLAGEQVESKSLDARVVLQEVSMPLRDAMIARCIRAVDWMAVGRQSRGPCSTNRGWLDRMLDAVAGVQQTTADGGGHEMEGPDVVYLPTGALQLFDILHQQRPHHHLVAADFTHFSAGDVLLRGVNAPIVSVVVRFPLFASQTPLTDHKARVQLFALLRI
jgi:hypothetical protein